MHTMKHKTPLGYRAPLKSRDGITAFLIERAVDGNPRRSYGPFVWNIKAHLVDLSFDHLLKLAQDGEILDEVGTDPSPRWLDACRAIYTEHEAHLWDWAVESARMTVDGGDTFNRLWDGDKKLAAWGFDGRSGGWLVLKSFDGVTFTDALQYADMAEVLAEQPFAWLRNLYRFVIQCDRDFRPEAVLGEVEYQAAWILFVNLCDRVESDKAFHERETLTAPCYI